MRDKTKDILWLFVMLLGVFLTVNWIYSRTQIAGWMPLPISITLLAGSVFQTAILVGKLLGPKYGRMRKVSITLALLSAAACFSVLFIASLNSAPGNSSKSMDSRSVPEPFPTDAASESENFFIDVRSSDYGFGQNGGTAADLESLIAACQELLSGNPDRHVIIVSKSDIPYRRIIEVVDALMAVGVSNISFSVRE